MQIDLNGQPFALAGDTTVAALLERLELHPVRVAVEINEELVPRSDFGATALQDGDRVEIVTFVGGG